MNISDTDVEILYHYIVEGKSMEKSGEPYGCTIPEVSELIHDYGFNQNRQGAYQRGEDCGRYRAGKPAACGLRITQDMIADYMYHCEYWNFCFAAYVKNKAAEMQDELRRQKAIEDENKRREQERRAQEQAMRQWQQEQAEAQRQREAAAKREAEQKKRDYPRHLDAARKYFSSGSLQQALDEAKKALSCDNTWDASLLIADIKASSINADQFAAEIIQEYTEFRDAGGTLSADRLLRLARAELKLNRKNDACGNYYRAADIWYGKGDFARADAIYTEALEKTDRYSVVTPDAAFRTAFCRSKKKNLTEDDHRFCNKWFEVAAEEDQEREEALARRTVHLRALDDPWETYDCAQEARDEGSCDDYVLQNLLWATVERREYNEALELIEEMEDSYVSFEPWLKGEALCHSDEHEDEEAVEWFEKQLKLDPNHPKALEGLCYVLRSIDEARACSCGLQYLKTFKPVSEREHYDYDFVKDLVYLEAYALQRRDLLDAALEYHPEKKAEELQKRAEQEDALQKLKQAQTALRQGDVGCARGLLNAIKSKGLYYYYSNSDDLPAFHAAMGEALARSEDAKEHAADIVTHLSLANDDGKKPTADQYLWLARARLELGKINRAVYDFFLAGDIFFCAGDYRRANEIYSECARATNSYSGLTPDGAYRAAYAREQVSPEDHAYCQQLYASSIEDGKQVEDSYRRRLYHLSCMGDAARVMECGHAALAAGALTDAEGHLLMLDAAEKLGLWSEVLESADNVELLGGTVPPMTRCRCLLQLGRTEEAVDCAEQALRADPHLTEALDVILDNCADPLRCANIGLAWLRAGDGEPVRAARILQFADQTGRAELTEQCLEYVPDEKKRRSDETMLLMLM